MKGYCGIVKNMFMEELSYREHYITMIFTTVIFYIVLYFLWNAIYAGSGGVINGTDFSSAFVTLALTGCMFRCLSNGMEWEMHFEMIDGNIIIKLVRPTNYMAYLLSEKIGSSISNIVVFAIPIFIIMYILFPGVLHIGVNIFVFILCMCISFCIMFLMEFMVGVMAFYTQSVWGLSTVKDLIIGFFAGAEVPLSFFPEKLKELASMLPFKSMYYDPVQILMDQSMTMKDYGRILGLQVVWLVVLFAAAQMLYHVMKKKIVVNGG